MTYDIRLLTEKDADVVEAFLKPRTAEAYFPRSISLNKGLVYKGHPFEADFFWAFLGNEMVGLIDYSHSRAVHVCAEDKKCLLLLGKAIAAKIKARPKPIAHLSPIRIILGPREDVDPIASLFGINEANSLRLGNDELYKLSVADLISGDKQFRQDFTVRLAQEKDMEELIKQMIDYNAEELGMTAALDQREQAEKMMREHREEDRLYLMEGDKEFAGFCVLHGLLKEARFIGPLWVPVKLRRRGYSKIFISKVIQDALIAEPYLKEFYFFTLNPIVVRVSSALGFKKVCAWRSIWPKEDFIIPQHSEF